MIPSTTLLPPTQTTSSSFMFQRFSMEQILRLMGSCDTDSFAFKLNQQSRIHKDDRKRLISDYRLGEQCLLRWYDSLEHLTFEQQIFIVIMTREILMMIDHQFAKQGQQLFLYTSTHFMNDYRVVNDNEKKLQNDTKESSSSPPPMITRLNELVSQLESQLQKEPDYIKHVRMKGLLIWSIEQLQQTGDFDSIHYLFHHPRWIHLLLQFAYSFYQTFQSHSRSYWMHWQWYLQSRQSKVKKRSSTSSSSSQQSQPYHNFSSHSDVQVKSPSKKKKLKWLDRITNDFFFKSFPQLMNMWIERWKMDSHLILVHLPFLSHSHSLISMFSTWVIDYLIDIFPTSFSSSLQLSDPSQPTRRLLDMLTTNEPNILTDTNISNKHYQQLLGLENTNTLATPSSTATTLLLSKQKIVKQ